MTEPEAPQVVAGDQDALIAADSQPVPADQADNKKLIQAQFGQNAGAYVESKVHRLGASLARLLALTPPAPTWHVLDVAAAIGYTGYAFAPHVDHVWITDITAEMLELARQEAIARGLTNVTVEYADAESLPYANGTFDLVTCRIAPHHFGDVTPFMGEAARVLRPGGQLAIVDNVVPAGAGGDYVNAFEKLRDPSHYRCLSVAEWLAAYAAAGLDVTHHETLDKKMPFEFWAKRHNDATQQFLRALLTEAPPVAAAFFRLEQGDGQTFFYLREGIFIGRKAA